jgi:hypothetical protein
VVVDTVRQRQENCEFEINLGKCSEALSQKQNKNKRIEVRLNW